jgi:hypothetical protein
MEDAGDPPQQTATVLGSGRQLFQQKSIKSTKQSPRKCSNIHRNATKPEPSNLKFISTKIIPKKNGDV